FGGAGIREPFDEVASVAGQSSDQLERRVLRHFAEQLSQRVVDLEGEITVAFEQLSRQMREHPTDAGETGVEIGQQTMRIQCGAAQFECCERMIGSLVVAAGGVKVGEEERHAGSAAGDMSLEQRAVVRSARDVFSERELDLADRRPAVARQLRAGNALPHRSFLLKK